MADVAHLVRASGCGSEGSGFNPHHSPQNKSSQRLLLFYEYGLNPLVGGSLKP
ncbi:MAG: hypothetical protein JWO61_143 [Candidatus Saccharibacteria bacterium]|nr:hypothetical protein [Candidatus Saccharibacteria bacterium]